MHLQKYRHPIPNDLREFWYYQRPDILDYMQTAYKDLDIQFLPDSVIKHLVEKGDFISQVNLNYDSLSTEILANQTFFSYNELIIYLQNSVGLEN